MSGQQLGESGLPHARDAAERAADGAVDDGVSFILKSTRQRPQTEAELRGKLAARGALPDVIDEAVSRAAALGAVDDRAFARAWVEERGGTRGYGAARLREELRRRQVPDDLVDEALAGIADRDEEAVAEHLARERVTRLPSDLPPEKVAQRISGFLQRRGHGPAVATRVARRISGLDREWD